MIKHKIKWHLEKVSKQLASLPELPANVELEIQTSLINFADSSRQRLDDFTQSFNNLPTEFRKCLLHIKPKIVLKDKSDIPVLEISDDESEAGSVAGSFTTPTGKRRGTSTVTTPSKRARVSTVPNAANTGAQVNGGGSFTSRVKPEEDRASLPPPHSPAKKQLLPEPFTEFTAIGRSFRTLRQVHDEILSKTTAGMPNRIPDKIYQELAMEAVKPWCRPAEAYLKRTMHLLQLELDAALNKTFEGLKKRYVYTEARKHIKSCLDEHRAAAADALTRVYQKETTRLLTFNEDTFRAAEREEKDILTHFRHYIRMQAASLASTQHVPWETLTEEKRAQELRRREVEMVKLGPDQFEREVEVVAYVRGYYRLAAQRFSDAVSQEMICIMIPQIRCQLPNYLEQKLGVRGPDAESVYERLMAEDEATAARRENLKGEKRKFETALASIEDLEMGETTDDTTNGLTNGTTNGDVSFNGVLDERGSSMTMGDDVQGDEA